MKVNLLFALLLFLYACETPKQTKKTPDHFILKGTFTGTQADTLFLFYKDSSGNKISQHARINNGSFMFKGIISSPVYAMLRSNIKIKLDRAPNVSNGTELFLSPGSMTVSLRENDFAHAKITGSIMQNDFNELYKQYQQVNKIIDSLYSRLFEIEAAGNTPKNHAAHTIIANKIDQYNFQKKQIDYKFITTRPSSYLSAYLLENFAEGEMRLDSIELLYNSFPDSVKKSVSGKKTNAIVAGRKVASVGTIARMPAGIRLNGSRFDPRTLKTDNYLLLYFWADYANDNAQLKLIYNDYQKKGLTILAISMDGSEKMWRDSVKKENTSMWHNILSDPVTNLDTFYNISQMAPSLLLLIDKNHTIIGRYRGDGPKWYKFEYREGNLTDLNKKLKELYNK